MANPFDFPNSPKGPHGILDFSIDWSRLWNNPVLNPSLPYDPIPHMDADVLWNLIKDDPNALEFLEEINGDMNQLRLLDEHFRNNELFSDHHNGVSAVSPEVTDRECGNRLEDCYPYEEPESGPDSGSSDICSGVFGEDISTDDREESFGSYPDGGVGDSVFGGWGEADGDVCGDGGEIGDSW